MGLIQLIVFFIIAVPIILLVGFIFAVVHGKMLYKKKQEEQQDREKQIADEARRKQKVYEEQLANEKIERLQREIAFEEAKSKIQSQFDEELNAIEKYPISLSNEIIKGKPVSELDVNMYTIRSDTTLHSCGDYTVVDVETTGLKVSCDIIEISAIRIRNFKPVKAYTTLIKPKKEIPFDITELTGITNEMVADAPNIQQVMPGFIDFVGKDNLLGHNLIFDLKFLYKNGFDFTKNRRRYYDTLKMAKSKLLKIPPPGAPDDGRWQVLDYKLDSVCEYFNIYRSVAHRSLSDCLATSKAFRELLDLYYLDK